MVRIPPRSGRAAVAALIGSGWADHARAGRTRLWRLAANLMVLLAFALQSYVTQTHFHPEALAFDAGPAVTAVQHASAYNPALGGDEEKVCPLCQIVASAGAFFLPGPPIVLSLAACAVVISRLAPVAQSPRAAAPAGFAWRSRAPPQP